MKKHIPTRLLLSAVALSLTVETSRAAIVTWLDQPYSTFWGESRNWSPSTVPGPGDTATFGSSHKRNLTFDSVFEVGSIVFSPGASVFVFNEGELTDGPFTISGAGITNNSGVVQTFNLRTDGGGGAASLQFKNSASAGSMISFIESGASGSGAGAEVAFMNSSSADSSSFTINGGAGNQASGAFISFVDAATAGGATFAINSGAANAFGGTLLFGDAANAGHGVFSVNAGASAHTSGGLMSFYETSSATEATVTANGGEAVGAGSGLINFFDGSSAEAAVLIAEGGSNGGSGGTIALSDSSNGGTARVEVFADGDLDISNHDVSGVTIGSLEGDGSVLLGANVLTVGSNNLITTFDGIIQGSGGIAKIGTGTLTLSGANLYTAGTMVSVGTLVINNTTDSGTGTGAVLVNAGTLGGNGTIAGTVTIGTGAFLAPAHGTKQQASLTSLSGLTFKSVSTYTCTFKAKGNKARTDKVIANGVTIESGASFNFSGQVQGHLRQGLVLTVISNTAATPIAGTFSNLPDGATLTISGNNFQASYEGGDGNDLTLTVVP